MPHGEQGKRKGSGAAGREATASAVPGHVPGGVALRHKLLNCFGSVLLKSSEVGRGEAGVVLLEVAEAVWL